MSEKKQRANPWEAIRENARQSAAIGGGYQSCPYRRPRQIACWVAAYEKAAQLELPLRA